MLKMKISAWLSERREFLGRVWMWIRWAIVIVIIAPILIFGTLLIEAYLSVYSFTKFEGDIAAKLVEVKGKPLRVFEGEDIPSKLRSFFLHMRSGCNLPQSDVRAEKVYVYYVPSRFLDTICFAIFYIDSKDKIVSVEIVGS